MRLSKYALVTAVLCALLSTGKAFAYEYGDPAVFFYGHGGGINATRSFDPAPDSKFKTGYNLGTGIGVQLNKYVAIRGNFNFARSRAQDPDLDSGVHEDMFNRYIYSGDVQVGYPFRSGFTPYLFAGGGGLTFDNRTDPQDPEFTRGFGKAGLGLLYPISGAPVDVFVQGTGMAYRMNRYGPARTLYDVAWTAGLRFRVPIGGM